MTINDNAAKYLEQLAGETRFGKNDIVLVFVQDKTTGLVRADSFIELDTIDNMFPMIGALSSMNHALMNGITVRDDTEEGEE